MRPYWLTIENPPKFSNLGLGTGITAISEEDARTIFSEKFGDQLAIASMRPISSVDEIEEKHVRPNMGNLLVRGVWFPLEFDGP